MSRYAVITYPALVIIKKVQYNYTVPLNYSTVLLLRSPPQDSIYDLRPVLYDLKLNILHRYILPL